MKQKFPRTVKGWLTFIIRLILEMGIAYNLYMILPDTLALITHYTSGFWIQYFEPITIILVVSYISWRIFSPKWDREDLVSITTGYVILSIPFVFLHDAVFNQDIVRLMVGVGIFALGAIIVGQADANYLGWFREKSNVSTWSKRIIELIVKLYFGYSILGVLWKIVDGLQYVTYIPIFGTNFPALNTTAVQKFYSPIMLALILTVAYYTINNAIWYNKPSVPKIVIIIILSMTVSVILAMPNAVIVAAVLNVLSLVLAIVIGIIITCIVLSAIASA